MANVRDSAIWAITYLYVRRFCNPEFRPKMATFVQDGYFGALAVRPSLPPSLPPYLYARRFCNSEFRPDTSLPPSLPPSLPSSLPWL